MTGGYPAPQALRMTTTKARTPRARTGRSEWLVPAGLLLLTIIPSLGGAARVTELASDPVLTAENARFVTQPVPVLVHIVCATLYGVLGAFQFVPRLRRNGWHRLAGRVVAVTGLGVALTGLWMTAFYDLPDKDTVVVNGVRYVVGVVMAVSLVLGVRAALRRDLVAHPAWMMRAYALAMGAGTQALLLGPYMLLVDAPAPVPVTVLMTAAWVINAAVAEWVIRRRRVPARV